MDNVERRDSTPDYSVELLIQRLTKPFHNWRTARAQLVGSWDLPVEQHNKMVMRLRMAEEEINRTMKAVREGEHEWTT